MPWVAAAGMCLLYLYNLPLVFAVYVDGRGLRFGVGVFQARFAQKSADKRVIGKSYLEKHKKLIARVRKRVPVRALIRLGMRVLKDIRLEKLEVRVTLGTGDAALTAEACGLLMVVFMAVRAATGAPGRINVTPDFARRTISGEACGIARLSAGHIIKAAVQSILRGTGG